MPSSHLEKEDEGDADCSADAESLEHGHDCEGGFILCINLYLYDFFHYTIIMIIQLYNYNDDDTNLEAGHDGEGAEAERHHVGDRGHSDRDAGVSHGLANLERSIKLPSSDHHKKVCKTC